MEEKKDTLAFKWDENANDGIMTVNLKVEKSALVGGFKRNIHTDFGKFSISFVTDNKSEHPMTIEEYMEKGSEMARKHYYEFEELDRRFLEENKKAGKGEMIYHPKSKSYYIVDRVKLNKIENFRIDYHCHKIRKDGSEFKDPAIIILTEDMFTKQ